MRNCCIFQVPSPQKHETVVLFSAKPLGKARRLQGGSGDAPGRLQEAPRGSGLTRLQVAPANLRGVEEALGGPEKLQGSPKRLQGGTPTGILTLFYFLT